MVQSFLTNIKDTMGPKHDKLVCMVTLNVKIHTAKCLHTGLFLILNHVLNDRFIDWINSTFLVPIATMISLIAIGSLNNCCGSEQACKARAM